MSVSTDKEGDMYEEYGSKYGITKNKEYDC